MQTKFNIGDAVGIKGNIRRVEITRKEKKLMFTMFNIGDTVLIKGTVRRIEITKDGVINYEVTVETDDDVLGQYGFNRVTEADLEKWREERYDSVH